MTYMQVAIKPGVTNCKGYEFYFRKNLKYMVLHKLFIYKANQLSIGSALLFSPQMNQMNLHFSWIPEATQI